MTSSYWQKVAVERVYVRCCERYAVARASDGKLVQLSRFALDFRALVERGASGARDVSRAALARACVAFLGDDPVAEVGARARGGADSRVAAAAATPTSARTRVALRVAPRSALQPAGCC